MHERILFVCTGNTCRSPMAEGLLRHLAGKRGLALIVRSAGVSAWDGSPISKHTADILQSKGISGQKTSAAVTDEAVAWADLILTMTVGHKETLIRRYPEALDKIYALKEFAENDPGVEEALAERQRLHAELQIKQALGQQISEGEMQRLRQQEQELPDFNIADPFGGDRRAYEQSAAEIERYLLKLLDKLQGGRGVAE